MALLDAAGALLFANRAYSEMFALEANRVTALGREAILAHIAGLSDEPILERLADLSPGTSAQFTFQRPRHMVLRRTVLRLGVADVGGHVIVWQDLSTEHRLQRSEAGFRTLVENAPLGIVIMRDGRIVFANRSLARIMGAPSEAQLVGRDALAFVTTGGQDTQVVREDGSTATLEAMAVPISFEGQPAIVGIVRDVTEERRLQALEREQARMDSLTGLYNRRGFVELIGRELARAAIATRSR